MMRYTRPWQTLTTIILVPMLAMTLVHKTAQSFIPFPCLRRTFVTSKPLVRLRGQNDDTKDMVNNLLEWTVRRAQSTLTDDPLRKYASTADEPTTNNNNNNNCNNQQTKNRGVATTTTTNITSPNNSSTTVSQSMPKLMYRGNPAITNTALAHSLWATVLRPNADTAIDATCGNGHDSLVLARLLFPETSQVSLSRLICIDIQDRACQNTQQALRKEYSDLVDSGRIQVLHQSHAPLPIDGILPVDDEDDFLSLGLVVYNLGWLPNNAETTTKEDCITQMETTLQSMVDAMLLLRIGGMLSVVTYPKTNAQEDLAVRTFLECAALLSSNIQTWQDFLESGYTSESSDESKQDQASISELVKLSMTRLVEQGDECQTWRVSEHRKLGMDRAPILLTATRIK